MTVKTWGILDKQICQIRFLLIPIFISRCVWSIFFFSSQEYLGILVAKCLVLCGNCPVLSGVPCALSPTEPALSEDLQQSSSVSSPTQTAPVMYMPSAAGDSVPVSPSSPHAPDLSNVCNPVKKPCPYCANLCFSKSLFFLPRKVSKSPEDMRLFF